MIELADSIKEWVSDILVPEAMFASSMAADIFGWAFDQVNWREVAQHWYDDAVEARKS